MAIYFCNDWLCDKITVPHGSFISQVRHKWRRGNQETILSNIIKQFKANVYQQTRAEVGVRQVRRLTMTSSNGNIFRVTGHLCGEFIGPGEFPAQRPVTRSFMFPLICVWIHSWENNREAETLPRPLWHHSNAWRPRVHHFCLKESNYLITIFDSYHNALRRINYTELGLLLQT